MSAAAGTKSFFFSQHFSINSFAGRRFSVSDGSGGGGVWAFLEQRLLWMPVKEVSFPKLDEFFFFF